MIVKVTQKNIDKGERGSTLYCPIALAIKGRKGLDLAYVSVRSCEAIVNDDLYRLPKVAQRFVARFDDGYKKKPRPFTFRMRRCQPNS